MMLRKLTPILAIVGSGLLAAGCSKDSTDDSTDTGVVDTGDTDTGDTDTDTGDVTGQSTAVITTAASDYSTGSFAAVDLDTMELSDELFVTSGDPVVASDEGWIFQINRLGTDSIRVYDGGDWTEPVWEQSLGEYSNPQDAELCGGDLFVTLYGRDYVGVHDAATGAVKGQVDLSDFNGADGVSPEASTMVEVDNKLYVGLQRFDTSLEWWAGEGSTVVEIDCASQSVTNSWDVGANVKVVEWPGEAKVLAAVEAFGDDLAGIYELDPVANTKTLLVEATAGVFTDLAVSGKKAVGIAVAPDYSAYGTHCLDLVAGTATEIASGPSYLTSVTANDRGQAWVTAGSSWIDATAPAGVFVYDIESCEAVSEDWMSFSLYPSSLAFY